MIQSKDARSIAILSKVCFRFHLLFYYCFTLLLSIRIYCLKLLYGEIPLLLILLVCKTKQFALFMVPITIILAQLHHKITN